MSSFSAPATYSPLILDTDQDGSVEATAGMGVDINGDGTADGAATGGDKMLAMSDITGDGEIGGAEVFGNMTVDPFSGEQLNAENGFEALQMVAVSAEEQTGVECIDDNGVVDLQALSQALESEGIGLGMISGDNNTSLESLGDVASIDTANYVTQQDTGDVQHNQLGSYEDTSGDTHKVDDVWFSGN
jgi:cation transport ATPase